MKTDETGNSAESTLTPTPKKYTSQMRAALAILSADSALYSIVEPMIDLKNNFIDWDKIFDLELGVSHRAACLWAFGLCVEDGMVKGDVLNAALSMDSNLQSAVIRALRLRWGLIRN
jgi:hypothetical protein